MILYILYILCHVCYGMDLATVSKQAKMQDAIETIVESLAPPEPIRLDQRRRMFGPGISLSRSEECRAKYGEFARSTIARTVAITCARLEKHPLGSVDLSKATSPFNAYGRFCKSSKFSNQFSSYLQEILGWCFIFEKKFLEVIKSEFFMLKILSSLNSVTIRAVQII